MVDRERRDSTEKEKRDGNSVVAGFTIGNRSIDLEGQRARYHGGQGTRMRYNTRDRFSTSRNGMKG